MCSKRDPYCVGGREGRKAERRERERERERECLSCPFALLCRKCLDEATQGGPRKLTTARGSVMMLL